MIVGGGEYRYERVPEWPSLPGGWALEHPGAAAVTSRDEIVVLSRNGEHPVTVWTAEGRFIREWGAGRFSAVPHGIHVDGEDAVWITDRDYHTVTRFTAEGVATLTLGRHLAPSPTCDGRVVRSRPFNMPANIATAPDGTLFAADGYGNHKVHHFAPDGALLHSWGRQGTGPGEFALVHNVAVNRFGRVFIADDENDRLQVFTAEGAFIEEWAFANPSGLCIRDDVVYVSELQPFRDDAVGPGRCRVSVWTLDRVLLASWTGVDNAGRDLMLGGHDLCVDSRGDIYVCEGSGARVSKFRRLP